MQQFVSARGIAVIISHHRSEQTLKATIQNLRENNLTPCMVVDNSLYTPEEGNPLADLGDDVHVLPIKKQGFGAAINEALNAFLDSGAHADYFMFCTHEILFLDGNVDDMLAELQNHPHVGAVGPLILDEHDHTKIYSAGGTFTPILRLPGHVQHQAPVSDAKPEPYDVEWMDGCCVLLSADSVRATPFDETYVFSFEEADQHLRIRRDGRSLRLVPSVRITQSTNGVAFFNLIRNFYLYRKRNYDPSLAWPGLIAMLLRQLARERNPQPLREFRRAINSARVNMRHVVNTKQGNHPHAPRS